MDDYYPSQTVDDAWSLVLHKAYEKHWQFGQDIVFTYGPWGFLGRGYDPLTYPVCVGSWLALAIVFVWAGWRLASSFTGSHGIAWLWLIGFTALATIPVGSDLGNRVTSWGLLLLFLHFFVEEERFSPLLAALAFTLGWLGLVKFTGLVEGGLLVSVIAVDSIVQRRRFPWELAGWPAGVVFFWLLAGQHLSGFWPYLKNSLELAGGYSEAMATSGVFDRSPLYYWVIAAAFCWLGLKLMRPQRRLGDICLTAGLGGILFLTFKQSYVRGDYPHLVDAALTLLLLALACLAVAFTRERRTLVAAGIISCACLWFTSLVPSRQHPESRVSLQILATFGADNLLAPLMALTTPNMLECHERKLARIRMLFPLPPASGKADLYSYRQDILFANGIDYAPRPAIQSYSAYTPGLARMDADWLCSGAAAPTVYFTVSAIDGRLPSLDDGLSWPELLTRYTVRGSAAPGGYLELTRSLQPGKYKLTLLQETNLTAEKTFALPKIDGLIWAQMDFQRTLAGRVVSFFYKSPVLAVNLNLADGTSYLFNLMPQLTGAGFLLSPLVTDNADFLALSRGDSRALGGNKVISMALFERGTADTFFGYQPEIKIKFYRLELAQPGPGRIVFNTP